MLYIANVSEEQLKNIQSDKNYLDLKSYAEKDHSTVIPLCVKVEEELATLEDEEKNEMLSLLGLNESGLDKLIKESYKLLGLISFLTAGEPEVRAWTIVNGTKAPEAAGKIHTDIERGFIKAEVIGYSELIECGSLSKAKEKGLVRFEGKEYIMKDGDVVLFRFNV
jgi:ribosome-binding ATPase YchF (GTP1/OBG family)